MIKDHFPFICDPGWSNDRVTEDVKCDFATEIIRYLKGFSISLNPTMIKKEKRKKKKQV